MMMERTTQIQAQLESILHCRNCTANTCDVVSCDVFKTVLKHMLTCKEGRACQEKHCASSRQIAEHWNTCEQKDCVVCASVRLNHTNKILLSSKHATSRAARTDTGGPVQCNVPPQYQHQNILDTNIWLNNSCRTECVVGNDVSTTSNNQINNNNNSVSPNQRRSNHSSPINNLQHLIDIDCYRPPHNLSDEMKLEIREAVRCSVNALLPRIEQTIKQAVRSEIIQLLQPQNPRIANEIQHDHYPYEDPQQQVAQNPPQQNYQQHPSAHKYY